MQQQLGTAEALSGFRAQALSQPGDEAEVVSEDIVQRDGRDVYVRKSLFASTGTTVIDTMWATDAEGVIQGFFIRPAQQ